MTTPASDVDVPTAASAVLLTDLVEQADRDGIVQLVVGAVIVHDHQVLLLKRPAEDFLGGIYELPSGKVNPGENLEHALRTHHTAPRPPADGLSDGLVTWCTLSCLATSGRPRNTFSPGAGVINTITKEVADANITDASPSCTAVDRSNDMILTGSSNGLIAIRVSDVPTGERIQ